MRTAADKGEGVKNWQNLADIFYVWPPREIINILSYYHWNIFTVMRMQLFFENVCCLEYSHKSNRCMLMHVCCKFAMSILYHWASNKITFSELIWAFIKQDCSVSNKSSRPKLSELITLIHQSFAKATAGLVQRCFRHVEK